MYRLERPRVDDQRAYATFANHRNPETRGTLEAAAATVLRAYSEYEVSVTEGTFSPLALTEDERDALRTSYALTTSSRPMAHIREQIFMLARHGRCPYCDAGQVGTLDHYLPQHEYPEFSTLSLNLIPACERCNRRRGSLLKMGGDRIWNAYLDGVPEEAIVFAVIDVGGTSLAVSYTVSNAAAIAPDDFARLRILFDGMKLVDFFKAEAVAALFAHSRAFTRVLAADGPNGLQEFVREIADDDFRLFGRNHWSTALFAALSEVEDFSSPAFDFLVRSPN